MKTFRARFTTACGCTREQEIQTLLSHYRLPINQPDAKEEYREFELVSYLFGFAEYREIREAPAAQPTVKLNFTQVTLDQLKQLRNLTWDGDLISKWERDLLVKHGLAFQVAGHNLLTEEGLDELRSRGPLLEPYCPPPPPPWMYF